MSQTSNIDDILLGAKTATQPHTPESQRQENLEVDSEYSPELDSPDDKRTLIAEEPEEELKEEIVLESEDDYGNPKTKSRTYTEDEHKELVNKAVRERLARIERNQPQAPIVQTQNQATKDFEYNPDSTEDWQTQLESFVEQTVTKMTKKQTQAAQAALDSQIQAEFEDKFHQGMSKFNDFVDIVGQLPISDAMTIATRSMKDPAAFLYAASKRNPDELKRISAIRDPYTQMVEIGRLEERMRKNKSASNAPRPIGRTQDDGTVIHKTKAKELTIEEQIAASDKRRLAARQGSRR